MRALNHVGVVEALEPRRLLAAALFGDFNTTTAGSWARGPVELDSVGYMFANDGVHGTELWRTDGTTAGTWMVKDINPGAGGSGGFSLQAAGGLLYFPATDPTGLVDLWRSDGTAEGTFKLTHAGEPNRQFLIGNVIDLNGVAIFGVNGRGIWRSDGTVPGTEQIAPYGANSNIARLGDHVYFIGGPVSGGPVALWKSDGTTNGTSTVREFSSSYGSNIHSVNGRLYFWADDAPLKVGREPWSSDGTAAGTVLVGDLAPGTESSPEGRVVSLGGDVFIITKQSSSLYAHHWYLFKADGTSQSANVVAELGLLGSYWDQPDPIVHDNFLYFAAQRGATGNELWRTDGTAEGTGLFIDLYPGTGSSSPHAFTVFDGRLYFVARTPEQGHELHSTDGTGQGTRLLKMIAPGTAGINGIASQAPTPVVFGNRLYFRADDVVHGMELWSTDGTSEGTMLLKDINTNTNDFNPSAFTPGPGGFHYFSANDGIHGVSLWKTNGTPSGTSLVKGLGAFGAGSFTFANGLLLFIVNRLSTLELWRSDGTEAGTFSLKTIRQRYLPNLPEGPLVKVGNRVFFPVQNSGSPSSTFDLWVSDGTEAGTQIVKAAGSGFSAIAFSGIEYKGKLLFFSLATAPAGPETGGLPGAILMSDGTSGGTTVVSGGFRTTAAGNWTVFQGKAYFTATTTAGGTELWRSDGTAAGTVIVADLNPGAGNSSPGDLVATAKFLYFAATDPAHGRELWRIDKHHGAPQRLTTLPADVTQVRASASGGVIFTTTANQVFRFNDSKLVSLHHSGFNFAPKLLGADKKLDYFSAGTTAAGVELWQTNGKARGTNIVQDLVPGPASSGPMNLSVINRGVFFAASFPGVGRELFVLSDRVRDVNRAEQTPPIGASSLKWNDADVALAPASSDSMDRIIDLLSDDAPVR